MGAHKINFDGYHLGTYRGAKVGMLTSPFDPQARLEFVAGGSTYQHLPISVEGDDVMPIAEYLFTRLTPVADVLGSNEAGFSVADVLAGRVRFRGRPVLFWEKVDG